MYCWSRSRKDLRRTTTLPRFGSGVSDPGKFKGKVNWGGTGGYGIDVVPPNAQNLGSSTNATFTSSVHSHSTSGLCSRRL